MFTAQQQRKMLNERFQMALEKKIIWKKHLHLALTIFDVSFLFLETRLKYGPIFCQTSPSQT